MSSAGTKLIPPSRKRKEASRKRKEASLESKEASMEPEAKSGKFKPLEASSPSKGFTPTQLIPPSKELDAPSPPVEYDSDELDFVEDYPVWPPPRNTRYSLIMEIVDIISEPPFQPGPQFYGNLPHDAKNVAHAIEREAFKAANAAASSSGLDPYKTARRYSREVSKLLTGSPADPAAESAGFCRRF